MIKIISDFANLGIPDKNYPISLIGEYPQLANSILVAFQQGHDLAATVHSPIVAQWLHAMATRYPRGTFVFTTLDARQVLMNKWGVSLPDDVRNEEIQENKLLDLDLQPQPGQGFADLLLSHFYAPFFAGKNFPFTQLSRLIASVDQDRWQANCAHPLLVRTYNQRLEAWRNTARSAEHRQVVDWFMADPSDLRLKCMAFRVLQNYPPIGATLLGEAYSTLGVLKLQLHDLDIVEKDIPDVISQVTYYLNAHQPASREDIEDLIKKVSGLFMVEFEILEKHLNAHPDWISASLVDLLEDKYSSFSRRLKKPLSALRLQIRPPKPGSPDPGWSADQMLDWAINSYLPYQAWCTEQVNFDRELFSIGDQFSQWLVKNWEDIHANSGRMIFNILPNIARQLNNDKHIHLILVVDNLGWSFAEILRDLFQEKGFYLIDRKPYISMLPSETEISKKCLLSASVGYTSVDDRSYTDILQKGWVPFLSQENAFKYVSDIGSLAQIETIDSRAYVVNYLAVDKALHKSKNEIGMSHSKQVRYLLTELIENVISFTEAHDLAERICIHVVSDHGSTQIPAEINNDIDPEFYKQPGFEAHSHRYLEVTEARFSNLADNLKFDSFFLPANQYLLPANVLCARRANRYLPVDRDVFVHGGVLPEEVIISYMTFEPITVPLKDLDILLKKNQFRYRLETLDLEVGNPNDASVDQVQVSCLNGNVGWECASIPFLAGHHKDSPQAKARFRSTSLPEEITFLKLQVRYRCRGETHTFDREIPIKMLKIVEEKSTNVFDD